MTRDPRAELVKYLTEAHAMERQSLELLGRAAAAIDDERLRSVFEHHREQTRDHERRLAECLRANGNGTSTVKDIGLRAGGRAMALAAEAAADPVVRFATEMSAFESLEIAAYGIICRLALAAGEEATAELATAILEDEEGMAERLAGSLDRVVELALRG
jgi:ferritin-like metal-binding protein YciE